MNNVIIVGSINMDIVVLTERHPEVGETVFGTDLKYFPGGKGANQALASSKLGGITTIIGMVGADSFGEELVTFLEKQNVKTQVSVKTDVPTGTALITVSSTTANNTIVVVPGANNYLTEVEFENVEISKGDVLVCQFEIPIDTIKFVFEKGRKVGTINILNPAPAKLITDELLSLVDILILNESELEFLSESKVNIQDENSIASAVYKIKSRDLSVIVTLGENGAIGFTKDSIIKVEGEKVNAVDTTGAGDCFVGAVATMLSKSASMSTAIQFANTAASICVTKQGAGPSMPSLDEVNLVYKP